MLLTALVLRIVAIALACSSSLASAQQHWSIGVRGHYGYLWPHRPNTWILVEAHAPAFELFMERSVSGDRRWHHDYRMPRYGLLVIGTTMANPQRIGRCIGVSPYVVFPLAQGKRTTFGFRVAWGLGYVEKPYDRHDNAHEIAIGSRINTAIQLMPELRVDLGRTAIHAALALDHWSNGSYQMPNLGLNFLSLALGASCSLGAKPAQVAAVDTTAYTRPHREFLLMGAACMSETGRPLNGRSSVFSFVADASWRKGKKGALSAGIDLFNKGDLATVNDELEGKSRASLTQMGVHGGGALLMGRGEMLFQMGAYLITPVPDDSWSYQRVGGRYRFGRHLVAGITLKTHFATADHWEFGIGYRWN